MLLAEIRVSRRSSLVLFLLDLRGSWQWIRGIFQNQSNQMKQMLTDTVRIFRLCGPIEFSKLGISFQAVFYSLLGALIERNKFEKKTE